MRPAESPGFGLRGRGEQSPDGVEDAEDGQGDAGRAFGRPFRTDGDDPGEPFETADPVA